MYQEVKTENGEFNPRYQTFLIQSEDGLPTSHLWRLVILDILEGFEIVYSIHITAAMAKYLGSPGRGIAYAPIARDHEEWPHFWSLVREFEQERLDKQMQHGWEKDKQRREWLMKPVLVIDNQSKGDNPR